MSDDLQTINLCLEVREDMTREQVAAAIRDAAERAAGQIEFGILAYPLEVDDMIQLGSDLPGVECADLFRST